MAADMKFVAKGDDKGALALLDKAIAKTAKLGEATKKTSSETEKSAVKMSDALGKGFKAMDAKEQAWYKERIKLQRASLALMDRQEKQRVADSMKMADKTIAATTERGKAAEKINRIAAIEESKISANRFDRLAAVAKVRHAQRLSDLRGNNAAQLAEMRRFNAEIANIEARRKEFPNTPFQQLLSRLPGGGIASQMGIGAGGMTAAGLAAGGAAAGVLLLANAFRRLATVIPQSVAEYEKQVKADKMLEAAMRATGNAAGGTLEQMKAYATEMEKVTRFGGDEIQGAQAVALQFTKIGKDVFPRAMQAAMDLAAATGGDLRSAMETVGRAIEQPENAARMLRQANILLSDSQRKMITDLSRTGDSAKTAAAVLGLFEAKVGGTARTTVLESEKLKHRWGDVMESIGRSVQPAVNAISRLAVSVAELVVGTDEAVKSSGFDGFAATLERQGNAAAVAVPSLDEYINKVREARRLDATTPKGQASDIIRPTTGKAAAAPVEAVSKLTDDQVTALADIETRIQRAKLEAQEDGMRKRLAVEEFEYKERLKKEGQFAEARAKLKKEHDQNVANIRAQAQAEASRREFAEAEEFRTREVGAIRDLQRRTLEAEAETDMRRMEIRHAAELEEANRRQSQMVMTENEWKLHEAKITALKKAQSAERNAQVKRDAQTVRDLQASIAGSALTAASGVASLTNSGRMQRWIGQLQTVASIFQSILAIQKAIAALKVITAAPTGGASLFVGERGGMVPLPKYGVGGGVYGPRHRDGGVPVELEGGENIWSRADVSRAGGQHGVEALKKGGGTSVQMQGDTIYIQAPISYEQAHDIGRGIADGKIERLRGFKTEQSNTPYYRAQGAN